MEIRGVWIADEILSRVFDTPSQSIQKLRSKRRSKIIKITLIKTGYQNLLQGCEFLCFNWKKQDSKQVARHFNLPKHSMKHMAVCGL